MNVKKMWRKGLLFAILAMALLTVCAEAEDTAEEGSGEFYYGPLTERRELDSQEMGLLGLNTTFEKSHTSYRDQLDPMGQQIYDALEAALGAGNYTLTISLTGSDIRNHIYGAYAAYDDDHPFETAATTGYVRYIPSGSDYTLNIETIGDPVEKRRKLALAVEDFYDQYVEDVDSTASDLEKYQYIYEYVAQKCYYNYPVYYDSFRTEKQYGAEVHNVIYNAYGALVGLDDTPGGEKGAVVCQGYADTYLLLCKRVGLPCVLVSGGTRHSSTAAFPEKSNHAWNAIRLNGEWYAVDVTWDDLDTTYSEGMYGSADISTLAYQYFTDNRYFLEGTAIDQDHKAYSQCSFNGIEWYISAPPLEYKRLADEGMTPENLQLTLHAPEGSDSAYFSDIQRALQLGYSNGLKLSKILNVDICLTENTVFINQSYYSGTCTVPAGKTYTVIGSPGKDIVLTRGDGFTDSLFYVQNNAVLDLRFVSLDGKKFEVDSPLIQTEAAAGDSESMVALYHAQIAGNRGAYGIIADGAVLLRGSCVIQNNMLDGKPANLKLGNNGYIVVLGNLAESQIGVTTNIDCYFAWPNRYYDWTDSDRAAFIPDDPTLIFTYDSEEKGLYCTNVTTGDKNQDIYITYAAVTPSVAAISNSTITLTNTTESTQGVVLYASMYDENDKMLKILKIDSVELSGNASSDSIALPEAVNGTLVYKVFAVGSNYDPIAENVVYDFSTGRET